MDGDLAIDALNPTKKVDGVTGLGSSATHSSPVPQQSSSLTPAEKKDLEQARDMAGVPVLPPPQQLVDYDFSIENILAPLQEVKNHPADLDFMIEEMMADATNAMLTTWINAIHKDGQMLRAAELLQQQKARIQNEIADNKKAAAGEQEKMTTTIDRTVTFGLLLAAAMLSIGVNPATTSPVGFINFANLKPIGQLLATVSPSAADGAMLSLVTLFSGRAVTEAGIRTLPQAKLSKEKYNFEFAKNYTLSTLKLVNNGQIETAVKSLMPSGTQETLSYKSSLIKIALLAQTLGFCYHLETGSITGQEFASMLQGKMIFTKDDPRTPLIASLNYHLTKIPQSKRAEVIENLMAYFDSKPNLDELSDSANAVRSLFSSTSAVSRPIAG